MFNSAEEIHQHIGQSMFDALPEQWDKAYCDIGLSRENTCGFMAGTYYTGGEEKFYSVDIIDGVLKYSQCDEAFYALYKMMKKDESDIPWNKARFELESDGSYDVKTKFDEDYIIYTGLDADAAEFDSLSRDFYLAIESWEGLPDDMPCPWKRGSYDKSIFLQGNSDDQQQTESEQAILSSYWQQAGEINETLELSFLNPYLADYPHWHGSTRDIVLVKPPEWENQIVATSGLSSPEAPFEIYLETNEPIQRFNSSWQMNLIQTIGGIIPNIDNFKERLIKHRFLTLQLDMDGAPEEWSVDHPDGNIGMFIGLDNAHINHDHLNFLPINIKLMRPDELLYCLDKAAQGREEIAELYKQQGQATLSCLDRTSVLQNN